MQFYYVIIYISRIPGRHYKIKDTIKYTLHISSLIISRPVLPG
jgi:hypothetical protein